jgi:CRISPR-associated endonuclease Csn1
MTRKQNHPDTHLSFDVGHSSIGWAVLRQPNEDSGNLPEILGTGVVTFGADDCLAVKRRKNRQARRHARATRQRIANMERLLANLGVLSEEVLKARHTQAGGDGFSWQRAANILSAARAGNPIPKTSWTELWDILRWYAHNRGYFPAPWANREENRGDEEDDIPDTEKVQRGHAEMKRFGTGTMAETIAKYTEWYEIEVAFWHQKKRVDKPDHFKGLKAAFERHTVVLPEVRLLLNVLGSQLPGLSETVVHALLDDWKACPIPSLKLPKRYQGGLLFGQLIPRFDNRIIGVCPILFARLEAGYRASGLEASEARHRAEKEAKLPSKGTPDFLRYRWAMQLANVYGAGANENRTRPLTADERLKLTQQGLTLGGFTKGEFKKAVRSVAGWPEKPPRDNLDNLLMHPDAEKALVLDPVMLKIRKSTIAEALLRLPEQYTKRLRGKLSKRKLPRHKPVALGEIRAWLEAGDLESFDREINRVLEASNTKRTRKQSAIGFENLLAEQLKAEFPTGRAPYARPILREAYEEVLKGWDPRAEKSDRQPRGCLCQTNELKEAQLQRRLEHQTNNHLIRHRLLILERLLRDLVTAPEFTDGAYDRIASIAIEVNRDLQAQSGKTRKEQEQDLGLRLGDFKRVAGNVEEECRRRNVAVTAGLIRKARVAEDLGWKCPYTGEIFDVASLLDGSMDRDHIIPHSDRQSDSLDSLVITRREVNLWKGRRTAMQFIREEEGKPVPGRPSLSIVRLADYQKHVSSLNESKGHPDDQARKKRRKRRLLTERYEEKEFTPGDLTVTSHLVRLGAQMLQRAFPPETRPPVISIPGSVTGEVRKAWRLLGCLAAANRQVLEPAGTVKRKEDIRGVTHLHHALDACVLGLTSFFFPRNGAVWGAMIRAGTERVAGDDRRLWLAMKKRNPSSDEMSLLRATGLYSVDGSGRMHLADLSEALKEQIRRRLSEKRVVQHIPADMSGVKLEENTRGVVGTKGGKIILRQRSGRDPKTRLQTIKPTESVPEKLLGLNPPAGDGKLKRQKGVRVITDNYGVAILDHAPEGEDRFVVIPWHRVWMRLRQLAGKNGGKRPVVIRNGQLLRIRSGNYAGVWRVFSAKNNASGIALDIGWPDVVRLENRTEGHKINVLLASLHKAGLELMPAKLIGNPTLAIR